MLEGLAVWEGKIGIIELNPIAPFLSAKYAIKIISNFIFKFEFIFYLNVIIA